MDRRSFLFRTGTMAAAAGAALATPAIAQGRSEWRMVTTWPKNMPGLGPAAQRLAERVNAATDGRVSVRVHGAGELVPAFEAFDAVSRGDAEMYHGTENFWAGKHPGFVFFSGVPMGLLAPEMDAWVLAGGGQALWDELSGRHGVKAFPCGNTGLHMGAWLRREITSAGDLAGLTLSAGGLGGVVLSALGVNVVVRPETEVFTALQSGAIDGAEWMGPWLDLTFGLYRAAPFYYYPGFQEPGMLISAGINRTALDSLSTTDRASVEAACLAENTMLTAEFAARNGTALAALTGQHGVKLKAYPDDVFDGFARVSEEVVGDLGRQDDLARRIRDSYLKSRREVSGWTAVADRAYANQRLRTAASRS
jgi:TRAP-type mannitol/chloroaromatic compound transport system substrate-binding protein